MKVSVCMITYNHEAFIARAIEGVLMQKTDFETELIIGEDCSSDTTRNICREYRERYPEKIRLLAGDRNLGPMSNFLRTFEACDGTYVAFCEGDDYWTDPRKLQKQVEFLEENADYGMVHSDYDRVDQVSGKVRKFVHRHEGKVVVGAVFEQLLGANSIGTASVCARTELVRKGVELLQENAHARWRIADYPLWLEISAHSKVGYLDESMAVYRSLPESASHSHNERKLMELIKSSYEVKSYFIARYGVDNAISNKIMKVYNSTILWNALQFRDAAIADEYLIGGYSRLTPMQKFHVLGLKNIVLWFIVKVCLYLLKLIGIKQRASSM